MSLRAHTFVLTALSLLPVSGAWAQSGAVKDTFKQRDLIVYVPGTLPATGTRSLVVVLHGGLGNASRIEGGTAESGLRMDQVAERNGFLVAYLNGTPVTRRLGPESLGWNAGGGCCGVPAADHIDDIAYITDAVHYLVGKYGIDAKRVFGIGHSNGAMMTLRLMCETNLYAAAVSLSGPLNVDTESCPAAKGKRILSIHGEMDKNVPVAGGQGSEGMARVAWKSEKYTQQIFVASGADFRLQIVPGATHKLDDINAKIQQAEGVSIAEKAARYFALVR